jgi:hypothetical protein
MLYYVRKILSKTKDNLEYNQLGEVDIKPPGIGHKVKVGQRSYTIESITLGEKKYLDVV